MSADPQVKSLLEQAEAAMQKKQWNQAINAALKAVSMSANCVDGYLALGQAYSMRREYDGAYAAYKRALQIDPDNAAACRDLYKICIQIRDYNDAIVILEQLIRLEPENPDYIRSLKDLYFRTGKTQQAMALAKEYSEEMTVDEQREASAVVPDSDNKALISGICRAISTKKWDDAANACQTALQLDSKHLKAKIMLAYVEFKRRDTDRVIQICREILEEKPDHILAKEYLSLSYIKNREWEKASDLLEELVLLDAETINSQPFGLKREEIVANLALTYEKRNLVRTAQLTYERLLQGNVKFPAVHKRLEKLEVPLARVSGPAPASPKAPRETPPPGRDADVDVAEEVLAPEEPASPEPAPVAPGPAPKTTPATPLPAAPVRTCPHCEAEILANAVFCSACGRELVARKNCINCGASLPIQAMFCPECGRDQRAIKYTCLHCLCVTESPAQYCTSCGAMLLQAVPGAEEIKEFVDEVLQLLSKDQKHDAIDVMKKGAVQFPHQAAALYGLGLLQEFIQKTDDSVAQYRKVLELPADPLILGETCRRLGLLLVFCQRRASEALEPLERGARLMPDDPSFHYVMGLAYLSMGETTKAMRAFNKIVEFDPHNAVAFAGIGQIYARNNRGNEAAQYYNSAISLLRLSRLLLARLPSVGNAIDTVLGGDEET